MKSILNAVGDFYCMHVYRNVGKHCRFVKAVRLLHLISRPQPQNFTRAITQNLYIESLPTLLKNKKEAATLAHSAEGRWVYVYSCRPPLHPTLLNELRKPTHSHMDSQTSITCKNTTSERVQVKVFKTKRTYVYQNLNQSSNQSALTLTDPPLRVSWALSCVRLPVEDQFPQEPHRLKCVHVPGTAWAYDGLTSNFRAC